ncbi:hypothetical protein MIR68_008216 [Amoeboaphelidium protococcarum]|nr:hypothetical protein MIR68_008216 [Amoeboaphelidium protococcarum]
MLALRAAENLFSLFFRPLASSKFSHLVMDPISAAFNLSFAPSTSVASHRPPPANKSTSDERQSPSVTTKVKSYSEEDYSNVKDDSTEDQPLPVVSSYNDEDDNFPLEDDFPTMSNVVSVKASAESIDDQEDDYAPNAHSSRPQSQQMSRRDSNRGTRRQGYPLIISNLPADVSVYRVRSLLSQFGVISKCELLKNRAGRFQGRSLVVFQDEQDAVDAYLAITRRKYKTYVDGISLDGHKVTASKNWSAEAYDDRFVQSVSNRYERENQKMDYIYSRSMSKRERQSDSHSDGVRRCKQRDGEDSRYRPYGAALTQYSHEGYGYHDQYQDSAYYQNEYNHRQQHRQSQSYPQYPSRFVDYSQQPPPPPPPTSSSHDRRRSRSPLISDRHARR